MTECELDFLTETGERTDLNQYWFSRATIDAFVGEIVDCGGTAALVSSPSVYFSLPADTRQRCQVLDYDRQWQSDPGYVFYDFNAPLDLPEHLRGSFDYVLVDPPFITREVWKLYAETTRFLARTGGRMLCTTIAENAPMMFELLGISPVLFRPSIPNLVYQYSVYTNYKSERLASLNPEIDDGDWRAAALGQRATPKDLPLPLLPGESAAIGSSTAGLDAEAAVAAALAAAEAAGGTDAVDTRPLPPAAVCLTELRERLGTLKRALEALRVPVQQTVRRPSAAGPAESLLNTAAEAAAGARAWLAGHGAELAEALQEPDALVADSDRWRIEAAAALIEAARGCALKDLAAYQEWANATKAVAAEVFKLSSSLLERIKALKRAAA